MIGKFEQMDEEKRARIINAAISEFAKSGYDKGSTNVIVKEAEISKGLIFHYFGSKANLFLYLFNYCTELITTDLYEKVDLKNGDILDRIHDIIFKKVILLQKHPDIFEFVKTAYMESNLQIKDKIMKKQQEITKEAPVKFLSNIDFSYFKDGLDIEKSMTVIYSTLESVSMKEMDKDDFSVNEVVKKVEDYLDFFKTLFYK
jgi:TetR/AcrR family transcriptional regulator